MICKRLEVSQRGAPVDNKAPGMKPTKQETTYEEGTYCYFDVNTWRKSHKEFHVEYDRLEDCP